MSRNMSIVSVMAAMAVLSVLFVVTMAFAEPEGGGKGQDKRLGSDIQTLMTPEVMFRALLTRDGTQRLELART